MNVPLRTVVHEWGRIGCVGFGGPPAHIALLRDLVVERRRWLRPVEFEDALAACNLLPGPASTQLAIYCAWRLRGTAGALLGGLCFILPGLVAILALAAAFLASDPPGWLRGAGAGGGAAVAAVAVHAGWSIARPAWERSDSHAAFLVYALAGAAAAAMAGPWVVVVLIVCGLAELGRRRDVVLSVLPLIAAGSALPPLVWVAFKVGALSYGGGFVIVPLMQSDAVDQYGWMSDGQFLNAVALGQVTPGPVTHTVAVVGYAAAGLGGGLLAAAVAFAPSFSFVLLGADRFQRLLENPSVRAFMDGAGPAALGAILGAAIPLALALSQPWQYGVLVAAAVALLLLRRGVVEVLLVAFVAGAVVGP